MAHRDSLPSVLPCSAIGGSPSSTDRNYLSPLPANDAFGILPSSPRSSFTLFEDRANFLKMPLEVRKLQPASQTNDTKPHLSSRSLPIYGISPSYPDIHVHYLASSLQPSQRLPGDMQIPLDESLHSSEVGGRSQSSSRDDLNTRACLYSSHFPHDHRLNYSFVQKYSLQDELGVGGYGFVMTAMPRQGGQEVAVKFIIKEKVPQLAWVEDERLGRVPSEVMLLCYLDHPNIVKCLEVYDDNLYIYMVQELHGIPWQKHEPFPLEYTSRTLSQMPSMASVLTTASEGSIRSITPPPETPLESSFSRQLHEGQEIENKSVVSPYPVIKLDHVPSPCPPRPKIAYTRRPSHDLFECIEQTEHKRFNEANAHRIFTQVVDAVHYLDSLGIAHRDIKDENVVIDSEFHVKLIDFGSAMVGEPNGPRPYYTPFFGTTAYASSEILQKKPYQAAPAEVWALGVLLSFLLTGASPFLSTVDAIHGNISLHDAFSLRLSEEVLNLLNRCLDPNPSTRITINEVKKHPWLLMDSNTL